MEPRMSPSSDGDGSLKDHKEDLHAPAHPDASPVGEAPIPDEKGFGRADTESVHLHQQAGINRIEAFNRIFGRKSTVAWMLYVSLALTSMAYVFDQSSTFKYLTFATSYFQASEYIGTISTAQSVISAYAAPPVLSMILAAEMT